MTNFKADIERKSSSSTVRFSVVEFSTKAEIASQLTTDFPTTIDDTKGIGLCGNQPVRRVHPTILH